MTRHKSKHSPWNKESAALRIREGWGIIDTSGRTRSPAERSVIALTYKSEEITIKYKANIKSQVLSHFEKKYSQSEIITRMHCAGIYLALKDRLKFLPGVFICADGINPASITNRLKQHLGGAATGKLHVYHSLAEFLGKKNKADRLANEVNKGRKRATFIFTFEDLKELINEK